MLDIKITGQTAHENSGPKKQHLQLWAWNCRNRKRKNILKTVEDRGSVPMQHSYEMAYGEPNGHVIDDVTWPWKVKVMQWADTRKRLEIHAQLWLHVTLKVKVIQIYLDRNILKGVESIGQTPCFLNIILLLMWLSYVAVTHRPSHPSGKVHAENEWTTRMIFAYRYYGMLVSYIPEINMMPTGLASPPFPKSGIQ